MPKKAEPRDYYDHLPRYTIEVWCGVTIRSEEDRQRFFRDLSEDVRKKLSALFPPHEDGLPVRMCIGRNARVMGVGILLGTLNDTVPPFNLKSLLEIVESKRETNLRLEAVFKKWGIQRTLSIFFEPS